MPARSTPGEEEASSAGSRGIWWAALFTLAPLAVIAAKHLDALPLSALLWRHVSLLSLDDHAQARALSILMVPVGSLLVVTCRLTLGLTMLGPFRPILIALALEKTGILPGSAFVVVIFLIVALLRPRLHGDWLPYFGRLSVLLAIVGVVVVATALVGVALHWPVLERMTYFPIIVLSLAADGFARQIAESGMRVAAWRASNTVLLAIVINLVFLIPEVPAALICYPELTLTIIAAMIVIATRMRWELLQREKTAVPAGGAVSS
jgi:hypothetical protein